MKDLALAVERLHEVVVAAGQVEINQLVSAVISALKGRSAYGLFGDVYARHLWDEFSWSYQKGADIFSDGFDDVIMAIIDMNLEKVGAHSLISMTAYCWGELDIGLYEDIQPGEIDKDVISRICIHKIKVAAGSRDLDLLSDDRMDVFESYVDINSPLISEFGVYELAGHMYELMDPNSDLEYLADKIISTSLDAIVDECSNTVLADLFERFRDDISEMIKKFDVIPDLEDIRTELLAVLDA